MPVIRKIQCCIHTERGKLTEYEEKVVLEQRDAKITRYLDITGAEGQRFWVEVQALQDFEWVADTFNAVVPFVAVDGVALRGTGSIKRYQPRYQYHGPKSTVLEDGKYVREVSEMFFQPLKLVEEEGGEDTINRSDDSRLQRLGRIEVKMYRTMEVRMNDEPWIGRPQVTKTLASVHEKAIKGRSRVSSKFTKSLFFMGPRR
ncbi:hypothetical protein L211DRAFT_409897 [Terfezia boudieri ATCC MYA-4762]|uniref:DUF7918 domain-containing protein n=1 Tax=Terfezia boudieri ATCC MYA-4762 TaxID=1051890 RepID=A0A3N4LG95_9PEZI|nr:hypothetical protein L211DRAFT_409897 [Terfezia boudieri ATCC MYA-4762]